MSKSWGIGFSITGNDKGKTDTNSTSETTVSQDKDLIFSLDSRKYSYIPLSS